MAKLLILMLFAVSAFAESRDLEKLYEKNSFRIGKTALKAYVADNDQKRAQGLMFIESLPKDTGMLFVFDQEQPLGFWMKNTLIPLSIGYFNAKGELLEVQEMAVASTLMTNSPPTYQSRSPAQYALEMTSGWFDKNKIKPGMFLTLTSRTKSPVLQGKLSPAKKGAKSRR